MAKKKPHKISEIQATAERLIDTYNIAMRREGDEWVGYALEYPEAIGVGSTVDECMTTTREILLTGIVSMLEDGLTLPKIPRPNSLCKFVLSGGELAYAKEYPFEVGETVLFLGEIPNMPGHCVIVSGWKPTVKNHLGKAVLRPCDISHGWHTENFVELSEDET